MRLLVVVAVSMLMLVPGAFAQNSSSSATQTDPMAAAKRETADLEKERLIEQMRQNTLLMQAQSKELEKLGQQSDSSPPAQAPTLKSTEQQHPEWFEETNGYRPCPWNMCPSPPPQ
jgi:hypothetical protein